MQEAVVVNMTTNETDLPHTKHDRVVFPHHEKTDGADPSSFNRQLSVEAPSFMEATTPMMKEDMMIPSSEQHLTAYMVNGSTSTTSSNSIVNVHATAVLADDDDDDQEGTDNDIANDNGKDNVRVGDDEEVLVEQDDWKVRFQRLLYCRAAERHVLRDAYYRIVQKGTGKGKSSELLLISGPCGSGKTYLAKKTLKPLVEEQDGFFIMGKFDRLQRPEPFRAFVAAFTQFTKQLLIKKKNDPHFLERYRQSILQSLGHEVSILTNLIPALKLIVGHVEDENPKKTGRDAFCQFAHVLRGFMMCLCALDHPIVLLFDDLQYADPCSLKMLRCLIQNAEEGFVIVATCVDTVSPTCNVSLSLRRLEDDHGVQITNVSLGKMSCKAIRAIVSETFQCPPEESEVLSSTICKQSNGNMLSAMEVLRWLEGEKLLLQCPKDGSWKWNDEQILHSVETNRIGDFMVDKLQRLPLKLQELLKVAACLGSNSSKKLLKILLDTQNLDDLLHLAQEHSVLWQYHQEEEYQFPTDCVQCAAYDLIPNDERESFHLSIGRILLQKLNTEELQNNIYLVLSQFKIANALITDLTEKHAIAMICLHGGKDAARSSAFQTASDYLDFGISLLSADRWKGHESDLCLALHNAAAEVCICLCDFDRADRVLEEILSNTRLPQEKLTAQCTKIYGLGLRGHQRDAIDLGVEALKTIGVTFHSKHCIAHLHQEYFYSVRKLWGKSDEYILRQPSMKDFNMLMAMRIMNIISMDAMMTKPKFFPFIALKMIHLTIDHGLSEHAPSAFSLYGMLSIGLKGDIDKGVRFGKLAIKLLERYKMDEYLPRVYAGVYGCIASFGDAHLRESFGPLMRGHKVGLITGDLQYASLNLSLWCFNTIWGGLSLIEVERNMVENSKFLQSGIQEFPTCFMKPCMYLALVLQGKENVNSYLETLQKHADVSDCQMMRASCAKQQLTLYYMFGQYDEAGKASQVFDQLDSFQPPSIGTVVVLTFKGLTHLELARQGKHRRKNIRYARNEIKRVKKFATRSPHNYMDKLFLLEGELASVLGKSFKAYSKFTCAIGMASASDLTPFHALALERLARHKYREPNSDMTAAASYFRQAQEKYAEWGAFAKVAQLQEESFTMFGTNLSSWQFPPSPHEHHEEIKHIMGTVSCPFQPQSQRTETTQSCGS